RHLGGSHGAHLPLGIHFDDIRDDLARARLIDEAPHGRETDEDAPEGTEPPVPGLHPGTADPVIPGLARPEVRRLECTGWSCMGLMGHRAFLCQCMARKGSMASRNTTHPVHSRTRLRACRPARRQCPWMRSITRETPHTNVHQAITHTTMRPTRAPMPALLF